MSGSYKRAVASKILNRLKSEPDLIQIMVGPRQVGKTTAANTVADTWKGPVHYAAADLALPPGPEWIETHWMLARKETAKKPTLLILDEVQKVSRWSEVVKSLWDEDRKEKRQIKIILSGSSALLLAKGTTESLAGRFFLHRCSHWSFSECKKAFSWDLDQYLFFGGYPGAATLIKDETAWRSYINDSLIETVLARDVLTSQTINKPVLLRNLFVLATRFPAQILSYNKMLGQLQDAGNTTTLAHYLKILENAFLTSGLERYSAGHARSRASSPKLILWNNALINAANIKSFEQARNDPVFWGRLTENAVGAHLINHMDSLPYDITYWRHRNDEVDYVVRTGQKTFAIEVKSGRPKRASGLAAFRRRFPRSRALLVGRGGIELEEFFTNDPKIFF